MPSQSVFARVLRISCWLADLLLVGLAVYLALRHQDTLSVQAALALGLCVTLGGCLPLAVYFIDYLFAVNEQRGEEARGPETLREAMQRLERLTRRVEDASEAATKATLIARQVPDRVEEKLGVLEEAAVKLRPESLESVAVGIEQLSLRLNSLAKDWEALKANLQDASADDTQILQRLDEQIPALQRALDHWEAPIALDEVSPPPEVTLTVPPELESSIAQLREAVEMQGLLRDEKLEALLERLETLEAQWAEADWIEAPADDEEEIVTEDSEEEAEEPGERAEESFPDFVELEEAAEEEPEPDLEGEGPEASEFNDAVSFDSEESAAEASEDTALIAQADASEAEITEEATTGGVSPDTPDFGKEGADADFDLEEPPMEESEHQAEAFTADSEENTEDFEPDAESLEDPELEDDWVDEPVDQEPVFLEDDGDEAEVMFVDEPEPGPTPDDEEQSGFSPDEVISDSLEDEVVETDDDSPAVDRMSAPEEAPVEPERKEEPAASLPPPARLPRPQPMELFGIDDIPLPRKPETAPEGSAVIVAKAIIGITNKLFARGDYPLSWEEGRALTMTGIGEWRLDLEGVPDGIEVELRLNDEVSALGGSIRLESGQHLVVSPTFPR